jgi:hypothetical protein
VRAGRSLRLFAFALVFQLAFITIAGSSLASVSSEECYRRQTAADLDPAESPQDVLTRPRVAAMPASLSVPASTSEPAHVSSCRSSTSSRRICVVGLRRRIPRMSPSDPGG